MIKIKIKTNMYLVYDRHKLDNFIHKDDDNHEILPLKTIVGRH